MKNRPVSASLYAKISLLASGVALMALVFMFAVADDVVNAGFKTALNDQIVGSQSRFVQKANFIAGDSKLEMQAASEDYWLGHAARTNTVPVSWSDSLQVGDMVTISSKGRTRVLRVETVAPVNAQLGHGRIAQETPALVVITARETGQADGATMQFVIDERRGAVRDAGDI